MYIPLDLPASEDLNATFRDLADTGIKASELTMNVEFEASFPFRIYDIAAEFRTEQDELIPGLDIAIDGLFEGPDPDAASESATSHLTMTLDVPDGGDFKALSAIDKLYLRLILSSTATGEEYSCFRPDDFIQGHVTVTVADGVIVDLKEL